MWAGSYLYSWLYPAWDCNIHHPPLLEALCHVKEADWWGGDRAGWRGGEKAMHGIRAKICPL